MDELTKVSEFYLYRGKNDKISAFWCKKGKKRKKEGQNGEK